MFALGHIYTNMTLGLFTDIAPMGSQKHIYIYVPSSGERFSPGLQHPVLTGSSLPGTRHPVITGSSIVGYSTSSSHRVFCCRVLHIRFSPGLPLPGLRIPSGGTEILTNSPFTPAWDASSIRSASGMRLACRASAAWSAYPTRSPPCGSSSTRTLGLLLAPESSGTSTGCAFSWNDTPRSSQD